MSDLCPVCKGKKQTNDKPCEFCKGKGMIKTLDTDRIDELYYKVLNRKKND
jgi:DnaJ-class molecular chaperone